MSRVTILIIIALLGFSQAAFTASAPITQADTQLSQLEQRYAKALKSGTAEFAKNLLDDAALSISDAKISTAAGKEKLALLQIEMAEVLLNAADAKAAEKELLEKVAVRRSELKKLEVRLEKFQQGEEN